MKSIALRSIGRRFRATSEVAPQSIRKFAPAPSTWKHVLNRPPDPNASPEPMNCRRMVRVPLAQLLLVRFDCNGATESIQRSRPPVGRTARRMSAESFPCRSGSRQWPGAPRLSAIIPEVCAGRFLHATTLYDDPWKLIGPSYISVQSPGLARRRLPFNPMVYIEPPAARA